MNTIEAYEQEIAYQINELPRFIRESRIRKLSVMEQNRCVVTGAGDSLAAAMITEHASDHRVRFVDPTDIVFNPSSVKDKVLYVLSVSGNTRANMQAVRMAENVAKTVAVTANMNSRLAKLCDEVITLRYKNTGRLTAGSISFTTTMLAALSLVRNVRLNSMKRLFSMAETDARNLKLNGHVYVIGSGITYPLAIYGCAKIYEVLGLKAQYAMLEQFCHMELFSLKKRDTIIIISDNGEDLAIKLLRENYNVKVFKQRCGSVEDNLLYYTVLLQLITLYNAKRLNIRECYFIRNYRLRKVSSSLIY